MSRSDILQAQVEIGRLQEQSLGRKAFGSTLLGAVTSELDRRQKLAAEDIKSTKQYAHEIKIQELKNLQKTDKEEKTAEAKKVKQLSSVEKARVSAGGFVLEDMGYYTGKGDNKKFHLIKNREEAKAYLKQSKNVEMDIDKFPEYAPYFENILSAYDQLPDEARAGSKKEVFRHATKDIAGRESELKQYLNKWRPELKRLNAAATQAAGPKYKAGDTAVTEEGVIVIRNEKGQWLPKE